MKHLKCKGAGQTLGPAAETAAAEGARLATAMQAHVSTARSHMLGGEVWRSHHPAIIYLRPLCITCETLSAHCTANHGPPVAANPVCGRLSER